jgi:hypothetical protein
MQVTVDGRVVGRPCGGHMFLNIELWFCWWNIVNWRPGGALKWKAVDCRLGRSGSVMWKAGTSTVVPLPVSVKDRWVGPHDQVLNVPIVYWCYGHNKLSSLPSTEGGFIFIASMVASGRETGYGPMDWSTVMPWIRSEALFLGSSDSVHRC